MYISIQSMQSSSCSKSAQSAHKEDCSLGEEDNEHLYDVIPGCSVGRAANDVSTGCNYPHGSHTHTHARIHAYKHPHTHVQKMRTRMQGHMYAVAHTHAHIHTGIIIIIFYYTITFTSTIIIHSCCKVKCCQIRLVYNNKT